MAPFANSGSGGSSSGGPGTTAGDENNPGAGTSRQINPALYQRPRLTTYLRAHVEAEKDEQIDIEIEYIKRQRELKRRRIASEGGGGSSSSLSANRHLEDQEWSLKRFGGRDGGYENRTAFRSFQNEVKKQLGDSTEIKAADIEQIVYEHCILLSETIKKRDIKQNIHKELGFALWSTSVDEQKTAQQIEVMLKLANELAVFDTFKRSQVLKKKKQEIREMFELNDTDLKYGTNAVADLDDYEEEESTSKRSADLFEENNTYQVNEFGEVSMGGGRNRAQNLFGFGLGYQDPFARYRAEKYAVGPAQNITAAFGANNLDFDDVVAAGGSSNFELGGQQVRVEVHHKAAAQQAGGSSSSSAPTATNLPNLRFLKQLSSKFFQDHPDVPMTIEEYTLQLLQGLEQNDENALAEQLNFDFEKLTEIFERKDRILEDWKQAVAKSGFINPNSKAENRAKQEQHEMHRELLTVGFTVTRKQKASQSEQKQVDPLTVLQRLFDGADESFSNAVDGGGGSASSAAKLGFPTGPGMDHLSGIATSLPINATQVKGKEYDVVTIPPPAKKDNAQFRLVNVDELPAFAQPAFNDTGGTGMLNIIQSKVYKTAFRSNNNFLMCAPTGAGKTNVALLSILRLIHQKVGENDGKIDLFPDVSGGKDAKGKGKKGKKGKNDEEENNPYANAVFKVVYLAPMKALCAEVVEKFSKKLQHVGIQVRELTGDTQLSRQELERTHVIVTVPEKWDVMTRNSTSGGGASDTTSLQKLVELIIVDEIHLLHESRGAVIESVIARTLRYQESSGHFTRLVGLSATLPNYKDVGDFLRCSNDNIFYFDGSYRPSPLEQTFLGIHNLSSNKKINQIKRLQVMNKACYDQVLAAVKDGHQAMVFVHSRSDTYKTAKALIDIMVERGHESFFSCNQGEGQRQNYGKFCKEVDRARSPELKEIFRRGFGMHHAGLLRPDRNLSENLFRGGGIKVLCCTATLAWGVNLPARKVIIKGTQMYDAEKGGFVDVGILDVQQIFGRAGRPGLDDFGQACLITEEETMRKYLAKLTNQTPIDSQFLSRLENSLNAEISMGNISSERDAADWLTFTYCFIRMFREPMAFGIPMSEIQFDSTLEKFRRSKVREAAEKLFQARLIRVDASKNYFPTDLGRCAARYYLDYETAEAFSKELTESAKPEDILRLFGEATEFKQMKIRDDETNELDELKKNKDICVHKIVGGAINQSAANQSNDSVSTKVSILLQAIISRARIQSFSLTSDMNYIMQNASRLFRAMFEITLTRVAGLSNMSESLLEWAKQVDTRIWAHAHMLRHFCYPPAHAQKKQFGRDDRKGGVLKFETADRLERNSNWNWWNLWDMEWDEIKYIIPEHNEAKLVSRYRARVPYLDVGHVITPITSTIFRIKLTLQLNEHCEWSDNWSGSFEPFYIWVENPMTKDILHTDTWTLQKKQMEEKAELSFVIPLNQPHPPQYVITIISERWVGLKFTSEFSVSQYLLPDQEMAHTPLLDLYPLPKTALQDKKFENLYKFSHFNAVQTQVFHTLYHTDYNVLVGAPTGSGKTNIAELAMFRLFNKTPDMKVIYIAPLKALAKERMEDWKVRFQKELGKSIVELTGDFTPDVNALDQAQLIITTPEKWDGISRHWQSRAYVRRVGLVIIDEIHLLGQDRGPVLEVIVSRMRYISANLDVPIRFVGLSTALANSHDIADWLGIGMVGCFNFKPSVRPVPMTVHIRGFPEKHYCPRMATMNRPAYEAIKHHSPTKPVLIFVSSRRQTRLTALDLIGLINADVENLMNDRANGIAVEAASSPRMNGEGGTTTGAGAASSSSSSTANNSTTQENFGHPFRRFDPATDIEYLEKKPWITDPNLAMFLENGIGIHHAGLTEEDRLLVEKFYLKNKIMILIATSTLAWGVNFPAHLVIIKGTEYFDGASKRYVDFPITDVLQMMGRAGRPQFDDKAVAVVFVHEPKKNFYRRFLYEPFPVESSLHEQLTDHLNAEVHARTITDRAEAVDYLTWTYFYRRLTANPSYYDPAAALQENSADASFSATAATSNANKSAAQQRQLTSYLEKLLDRSLADLVRAKCIRLKDAGQDEEGNWKPLLIEPQPLGKVASLYYMGHKTVFEFQNTLEKNTDEGIMSFLDILKMICNCPEYRELPVRHNEDQLNMEFAEKLPIPLDLATQSYDSPHTKAFLLLQAHLFQRDLPSTDYKTDLKSVLDRTIPIIQALVDIASEEAQWRTCLNLITLLQCLHQATHPWRSSLFTLPYLNSPGASVATSRASNKTYQMEIVEFLDQEESINSLPELLDRDYDCRKILKKAFHSSKQLKTKRISEERTGMMLKEISDVVRQLPKLRLAFKLFQVKDVPGDPPPEGGNDYEEDEGDKVQVTLKLNGTINESANSQNKHMSEKQGGQNSRAGQKRRKEKRHPTNPNAIWNPKTGKWKERISLNTEEPPEDHSKPTRIEVPSGCNLELEIYTWYANSPMKYAFAPKFPKKKTYSWWLLLGDAENDELIQMKRVLMQPLHRTKKVVFDFEAPEEDPGESFVLNLCCSSDSFFGLDQQYDLEICLVENPDLEEQADDSSQHAGDEGDENGDADPDAGSSGENSSNSPARSREEWEDGLDEVEEERFNSDTEDHKDHHGKSNNAGSHPKGGSVWA
ncbi:unnamed protein product [Amoebophrya sp. A120]|nr:unnamed protein product [Amoebophrya sp. A120]|eukprot:GSA120T00004033001.1